MSLPTLEQKPGLGERLVKAVVLGIHFVRTRREETERILKDLSTRLGGPYEYERVAGMPRKPYPGLEAILNVYELACMKSRQAKQVNPLALWDLHYLRKVDGSGFIDRLYR